MAAAANTKKDDEPEFEKPASLELILDHADEVMTTYQIAHALIELAQMASSEREDLRGVYLKSATALADTFALKLIFDERQRLQKSIAESTAAEQRLRSAATLRKTVRERGRIVHHVRGQGKRTVSHGYQHGECVWCKLEDDATDQESDDIVINNLLEQLDPLR